MNTRASGVVLAIVLVLSAVGSAGCGGTQSPPDLHVPGVATPSPADAALEQADLTRACHLAATGLTYGRHVKQGADGAGRLYQVALPETMASGAQPASQPFFDPEASGHPVSWLSQIACAADAGPVQLSFAPSGERLGWVGLDGSPRLWSWVRDGAPVTITDLELRSVSGAPGGGIAWSQDGGLVALSAWYGIGLGGATLALAAVDDGRVLWQRELDGDVLAWFDEGHLAWATAPWQPVAEGESLRAPTTIELWRMDEPAAESGADSAGRRVDVLELGDEEAVERWFVER